MGSGAILAFAALLYTHNWGLYLFVATAVVLAGLAASRRDRRLGLSIAGASAAVLLLLAPVGTVPTGSGSQTPRPPGRFRPQIGDFFADQASALGGTLGFVVAPLLVGRGLVDPPAPPSQPWPTGPVVVRHRDPHCPGRVGGRPDRAVVDGPVPGGSWWRPCSWPPRAPWPRAAQAWWWWPPPVPCWRAWSAVGSLLPNPNAAYAKSNVAVVAHAASAELKPGDVVVVTQTEQLSVLAHYLPKGTRPTSPRTGPVSDPFVVDWRT